MVTMTPEAKKIDRLSQDPQRSVMNSPHVIIRRSLRKLTKDHLLAPLFDFGEESPYFPL